MATVTFNRPRRLNALTFETYAELQQFFVSLREESSLRVVILTGSEGNFCSGGDVHEIIGPLTRMGPGDLRQFTAMTNSVIRGMREAPQIVISAIEGVCVGAGACLALASELRVGTPSCRVAFLFARVGLSGADMGACALLPRLVGHGRASDLLLTGREIQGTEAFQIGFLTRLVEDGQSLASASALARALADGPTFAHATTKAMLEREAVLGLDGALDAETEAQARCMETNDFREAYDAFVARRKPAFKGD